MHFFVIRNWKTLTDSRKRAKILADNRKSHHPINETLFYRFVFCLWIRESYCIPQKFPLKSGPSYAIVTEKTNFTDGHVHVLSIFVKKKKKLFSCTVLTRENCKTARERGKNAKQSFASHVLSLLLWAIDEVGKINRLPRWV